MVVAGDWTYLEAKELAPRALIAAIGVNLSLFLLGQGIVISNELVKGFLQVDPNSLSITTDRLVQSGTVAPIVLSLGGSGVGVDAHGGSSSSRTVAPGCYRGD